MNEWVKISEHETEEGYYVMVGDKYVSGYSKRYDSIEFSKSKDRAKGFYKQEDGKIIELEDIFNDYPEAKLFAVRTVERTEEKNVEYTG